MSALAHQKRFWLALLAVALTLVATWQIVLAQAPTPNPLPNTQGVDLATNGPAASIHGDPLSGRQIFAANCATCHGALGAMGEDNPGSEDGTVPALNPASEFLDASGGDPEAFAKSIDLFIQHGSRPAGDNPQMLMPAWGDQKLLSQPQIADVEAYVMQLNGLYWPDKWYPPAEVQMTATRASDTITYTITIVNHGGSDLTDVLLRDTLPPGLAYIQSDYFGLGNNPAKVDGSTAEWDVGDVPTGASSAPFTLVTGLTGSTVPPNVAQVLFTFCTYDGTCLPASQVSDMVLPGATHPPESPASMPMTSTEASGVSPSTEAAAVPNCTGNCTAPGTAISQNLTGDPAAGAQAFAANCVVCHGDQGKGGQSNPGSADGTVPALNPIDPIFKSKGMSSFALAIDLFLEHGSTPEGNSPTLSMPAFGDKKVLMPQQIADLIAYVMSLNP